MRKASALLVSRDAEDHQILTKILTKLLNSRHCITISAQGLRDGLVQLSAVAHRVLICDSDLTDGSWRDLLNELATMPNPPKLIVTSRLADEQLWAEVLNLGGYDVLAKPFESEEVVRVVGHLLDQPPRVLANLRATA